MLEKVGKSVARITKKGLEKIRQEPKGPKTEDFPTGSVISRNYNNVIYRVELPDKQGLLLFNGTTGFLEEEALPDKTIFYGSKGKKIRIKYETGEEDRFDDNEQLVSRLLKNNEIDIYENGSRVARILENGDKQIIKGEEIVRTIRKRHDFLSGKNQENDLDHTEK
ncbi:MAG: hypothetical protein WC822_03020 [Candidatus Paceibacterota bacterium]|jgi:hypothetical protein